MSLCMSLVCMVIMTTIGLRVRLRLWQLRCVRLVRDESKAPAWGMLLVRRVFFRFAWIDWLMDGWMSMSYAINTKCKDRDRETEKERLQSLSSLLPIPLPFLIGLCPNALRDICLPPFLAPTLQLFPHILTALACQKPCTRPEIVLFIRQQEIQNLFLVALGFSHLVANRPNRLGVFGVERGRLHIPCYYCQYTSIHNRREGEGGGKNILPCPLTPG